MTQSDIILTFFTLVYGLMLLELGSRLHVLIRNRKNVKWHFLPLLSAWYVFLTVLKNWWSLSLDTEKQIEFTLLRFLFFGHLFIIMYLLTTSVLPDKVDDKGIDLKKFYFDNNKYFWGVVSLSLFMVLAHNVFYSVTDGVVGIASILSISLFLTFNKRYWVHVIGLSIFIISMIIEILFDVLN